MSQLGYLILAIVLLVVLLGIFVLTFVLYVRQKPPKGCENLGVDESKCSTCSSAGCRFYRVYHSKNVDKTKKDKTEDKKKDESDKKGDSR